MKLKRMNLIVVLVAILAGGTVARAQVQTFIITAHVTDFSATYQTNTFGITGGDLITGCLRYDPSEPGFIRHPGDPVTAYDVSLGGQPFLSFTVRGQEFDLFGGYLNVYFHGAGIDFDELSTSYNGLDSTSVHSPWGNFISGGLNRGDFTLLNPSGTTLNDSSLPRQIDLETWPTHYILLNQAPGAIGGVLYGGFYLRADFDSIVVTVPEPGCAGLFALGAIMLFLRWRRVRLCASNLTDLQKQS